jgi:hypothetical protein
MLQADAHGGTLHLRVGIVQPGQNLLAHVRLLHEAPERRGGVQHLRVIITPTRNTGVLGTPTLFRPRFKQTTQGGQHFRLLAPGGVVGQAASRGRTTAWLSGFPCWRISTTLLTRRGSGAVEGTLA